ncbi:hypothetical protein PIB30_032467 [Stylosanthes scabra]|uniref:Protein kinase domain-containing protein n=1 Tax=Stylosanthes scabra TaxID=79078 RepID=A0ABU6TD82_9FABA|nr:hypothetical protein [Stylosanthes scabra]
MVQLSFLELAFNNLVGNIPPTLGNLSSLNTLSLANNFLEGPIIQALRRLTNLVFISLTYNNLSGQVPSSFYNLSNLQVLDISDNQLEGTLSPNLHLAFPNLSSFIVGWNHFTGNFPSSLSNLTELIQFDISFNSFRGPIPPTWGHSNNLRYFGIINNSLIGTGGAQDFDFLSSLTNCTQLSYLILQGNNLGGVFPDLIGNFSGSLSVIEISNNQISGRLPEAIGNLFGLRDLLMHENSLEGTIPDSIGKLKNLGRLSFAKNNFSGNIPNSIGNLSKLSEVYMGFNAFGGSIPFTLRYCTSMQLFNVRENNLSGNIPTQTFGYQQGLVYLDLSTNSFTSPIPSDFGSLKHLSTVFLYENKLSGVIPMELFSCSALTELYLYTNSFHGSIPSLFGSLKSLEILDLSSNFFSGTIPHELENLTLLNGLNLSDNQLYGQFTKKPKKLSSSPSLQHRYLRVSYGELHQATNGFSLSNLVGTGSSGSVYRGTLVHFERPVAVKVLNLQTRGASKSFMSECKALGKIKHRNLVNILTCCSSVDYKGDDFKAIVFEFMPNGSLETLLHNNEEIESRNLSLDLMQRTNIALDVAFALDYLHNESEEAVVHCDVKPTTSYNSGNQASSSVIKGTIGYLPPEYGEGGSVSPQGDIYSYGILLLEILTGKRPTDAMFGEGLSLTKFCKMAITEGTTEIVDARLLLTPFDEGERRITQQQNIEECLVSFARIGVACSQEYPTQRMSIKDAIMELHAIRQKLLR